MNASSQPDGLTGFLTAEYERIAEALYRNEEVGERRVQFFTGLVTAVFGGILLLATAEKGPFFHHPDLVARVALYGAVFLLSVGLLTYDRVLRRDQVRDEYKKDLDAIRACFLEPARTGSPSPTLLPTAVETIRTVGKNAAKQEDIGRLGQLMLLLNALIAATVGITAYLVRVGWPDPASDLPLAVIAVSMILAAAAGQWLWWNRRYGPQSTSKTDSAR